MRLWKRANRIGQALLVGIMLKDPHGVLEVIGGLLRLVVRAA